MAKEKRLIVVRLQFFISVLFGLAFFCGIVSNPINVYADMAPPPPIACFELYNGNITALDNNPNCPKNLKDINPTCYTLLGSNDDIYKYYAYNSSSCRNLLSNFFTTHTFIVYLDDIFIKCIVAFCFVLILKKSKFIALAVLLVTLISWPIFDIITLYNPSVYYPYSWIVVISEVIIWISEAIVMYLLCKRRINLMSFKQSLALSTLTNAISFIVGLIIFRY